MSRRRWAIVLVAAVVLVVTGTGSWAAQREGTDLKQLAARGLPSPGELNVAVMPFSIPGAVRSQMPRGTVERQTEMPRACVLLNLQRHGFGVVPVAKSLSLVPGITDKAMDLDLDDKLEGDIGRAEALEAGKALGANWVVYGKVVLRMDFTVKLFRMKPIKVIRANLHLAVADVESEEVLYWVRMENDVQGSSASHGMGPNAEDSQKLRDLLVDMVSHAFHEIAKALPKHEVGPEVTREQLEQFIGAMGL